VAKRNAKVEKTANVKTDAIVVSETKAVETVNADFRVVSQSSAPYKVDLNRGTSSGIISQQWFSRPQDERFTSMDSIQKFLLDRTARTHSLRIDSKDMDLLIPENINTLSDANLLGVTFPGSDGASYFTNWAFGQMCQKFSIPANFMHRLPSPLAADCITYALKHSADADELGVGFTKSKDGVNTLRRVSGPNYGVILDSEVAAVFSVLEGMGYKVPGFINWADGTYDPTIEVTKENTTLFASDRDVFLFLVDDTRPIEIGKLPDGSPDYVFRGILGRNSEVGCGKNVFSVYMYRGSCQNRCMWGIENEEHFSIKHSRRAPKKFAEEARPAILELANNPGSIANFTDCIVAAKEKVIANGEKEALAFLKTRGFTGKFARESFKAWRETEQKEEDEFPASVWDFSNAVTAAARNNPYQNERTDLEIAGTKILSTVRNRK